jgi:hypothetical protein
MPHSALWALFGQGRSDHLCQGDCVTSEAAGQTENPRIREARLKAEFAHLYPTLEPGRWEPAAAMADRIVAWLVRQPDRGYMAPERVLRSEHFDFRGGTGQPGPRHGTHGRRQHPA